MALIPEPTAQTYADSAQASPMADFGYMADKPALATALGHDVGQEIGVDTSQPQNLAAVMHSTTYAKRLDAMKSGKDDRLIKRVLNTTPNPLNPKASGNAQEMDAYTGQEQNTLNSMRANAVMAAKKMDAQKKLAELSDFDAESYTSSRLKELNPTADVDTKILDLRMQALISKSALRNQLRALDPVLRDQALNRRMAVFDDAIAKLSDIREARVASATAKIKDEIASKNEQKRTAKASVDALDSVIASLKDNTDAGDTIYKIRLERAKAQKVLDKVHGSGVPDQEDNIVNYLLNDLTKRGHTPTASDIANAKRIAKETLQKSPALGSSSSAIRGVLAAGAASGNGGMYGIRLPADPSQEANNPDGTLPQ